MKTHKDLVSTIPLFMGSKDGAVIPDTAKISGTIRNFIKEEASELMALIESKSNEICQKKNFEVQFDNIIHAYPTVSNTSAEVDWVREAVSQISEDFSTTEEGCPILASEDFSYFLKEAPGCFFFVPIKGNKPEVTLHSSEYLFDDQSVEPTSKIWQKLVEIRLNFV